MKKYYIYDPYRYNGNEKDRPISIWYLIWDSKTLKGEWFEDGRKIYPEDQTLLNEIFSGYGEEPTHEYLKKIDDINEITFWAL